LSGPQVKASMSQTISPRVTRLSGTNSTVRRIAWRNATAAVVLALAYLPLTAGLWEEGWSGPYYKFVPVALLCAGILMTRAWRQSGWAQPEAHSRDAVLLGMAWAILLVAVLAWSPALGAVSALLLVIALLDARGGWPLLRHYAPALALLCLALPLPHSVVSRLSLAFQGLVTRGAATVLDRLAVPNLRSGIILELADRQWLVDEAASGADGVLLVLAITLFYAFSARRSALSIVLLLAAALFWAVAVAVARVAGVAYLGAQRGEDLLRNWPTAALGLVAVAATLALVFSADRLWWVLGAVSRRCRFWNQAQIPRQTVAIPNTADCASLPLRMWVSWQFTAAFGLLAMIQLPLIYAAGASRADARRKLDTLSADTLPAAWENWQRLGFEARRRPAGHPLGSRSRIWRYRRGSLQATLAVDDPAPSPGVLTPYFQGLGWTVTESTGSAEGVGGNFREYRLDKPLGRSAQMFVGRFDAREQPLDVASSGRFDQAGSFLARLAEPGVPAAASHQVELLVECPRPLTEDEVGQARVFFRFAQHLLHEFARQPEEVRP
jgi:exosortase